MSKNDPWTKHPTTTASLSCDEVSPRFREISAISSQRFGKSLLGPFSGGFEPAYPVLVVLTFGVACRNLSFGVISPLNMSGGAKRGVPWLLMLAAVSFGLSVIGTVLFDLVGTAAAFVLSRVMVTLIMMQQLRVHRTNQLASPNGTT